MHRMWAKIDTEPLDSLIIVIYGIEADTTGF